MFDVNTGNSGRLIVDLCVFPDEGAGPTFNYLETSWDIELGELWPSPGRESAINPYPCLGRRF